MCPHPFENPGYGPDYKTKGLVKKIELAMREIIKNQMSMFPLLESFIVENEIKLSPDVVSEIH